MADGRITDYTPTSVSAGATISPSDENTNRTAIQTSINNGNDVLIDLEQNYAGTSAPTSAPDGKLWYNSTVNYLNERVSSTWAVVPHDGITTNFAFGKKLTVVSNFSVGQTLSTGALSVPSNFSVAGAMSVGSIPIASNFTVEGVATVVNLDIPSNFAVAGISSYKGVTVPAGFSVSRNSRVRYVPLDRKSVV